MSYRFGKESEVNLASCHKFLQLVARDVILVADFKITWGYRVEHAQNHMVNTGRSKTRWPNSYHNGADGSGRPPSMALDFAPWPIDWGDTGSASQRAKARARFYFIQGAFAAAANRENVRRAARGEPTVFLLTGGHDWDGDNDYLDQTFDDLGHVQIKEVAVVRNG